MQQDLLQAVAQRVGRIAHQKVGQIQSLLVQAVGQPLQEINLIYVTLS
jgi:hypothetical protein